jgi:hypothetical protein
VVVVAVRERTHADQHRDQRQGNIFHRITPVVSIAPNLREQG